MEQLRDVAENMHQLHGFDCGNGTGKGKTMLRIVECEYPNSEYKYGIFYIGDYEIGRASKVESGWIPTGKRKAMPEEIAAKVMIDSIISMARRDEAHARKMLDALRAYCGEARSEPASCACQRSHGTNGWGSGDEKPLFELNGPDGLRWAIYEDGTYWISRWDVDCE